MPWQLGSWTPRDRTSTRGRVFQLKLLISEHLTMCSCLIRIWAVTSSTICLHCQHYFMYNNTEVQKMCRPMFEP